METDGLYSLKSWNSKIVVRLIFCAFFTISNGEQAPEDENQWLSSALDAVIADKPLPKDTAQVWTEIQRRLQWGQNDIRLLEAQGRLAFKQGRWLEALAALQKLADPSPAVMEILAECLNSKGEKYEAAALMLKAARIYGPNSAKALPLFQNYLAVRQDDIGVQSEFAGILTRQGKLPEAARIYRDHPEAFIDSIGTAFEAGKALEAQKWETDALKLYILALGRHPKGEAVAKRVSVILASMTGTPAVAEHWQRLWELFPLDTLARNRALSVWESIRDVSHYRALLEQALRQDSVSPFLVLHAMRDAKTRGDRGAMKRFAAKAAKSNSCTSDCAVILAETLEGDAEISKYLSLFLVEVKAPKPSPAMLQAVARGLALQGKFPDACSYYEKANAEDSKILEGRNETLEDLSHCEQPSALSLLAKLGGATSSNSSVLFSLAREALKGKKWTDLSKLLGRLAAQPSVSFKEVWPMAEALSHSSQTGGDTSIPILKNLAMAKGADTVAVAVLLGHLYFERKRCDDAMPQLRTGQSAGQGGEDKLAECWKQKGNKKEAAYWTLRAARAQGPDSKKAPPFYLAYLDFNPGDPNALTELAAAYRKQGKDKEEAAIYKSNPGVFIDSESVAKVAGAALEAQKFTADAAGLYAKALDKNPKSEALAGRLSALLPGLDISVAAGRWQRLWELFPSDTASRNKALSAYAALNDSSDYRSCLEKALLQDPKSPMLNHRAALASMTQGDKKSARKYAVLAVKGNSDSAMVSILAMTASNDEEIKTHHEIFLSEIQNGKPSAFVLGAAARGLGLKSKTAEACALYEKAYAASSVVLKDKPEVLEDLSRCEQSSSLVLLTKLGGAESDNPAVLFSLVREAWKGKKWDDLAKLLLRLSSLSGVSFVEVWPMTEGLALSSQNGGESSIPILKNLALAKGADTVAVAVMLGQLYFERKRCDEALPRLKTAQNAGRGGEEKLADCWKQKGNKKEAAQWTLKAAQVQGPESKKALSLYLAYLEFNPGDRGALTELAAAYRKQGKSKEEAAVYKANPGIFIDSESVAKRAGSALEAQKYMVDAANLYAKALEKNPKSEALAGLLSNLLPGLDGSIAAPKWQRLWELFPSDTVSRNKALSSYEAIKDSVKYLSLLEKSLTQDPLSPWLNRRAALTAMALGDKKSARKHAAFSVKGNSDSTMVSILAATVSIDEEINDHLDLFISESRSGKPSPHVLWAAARGLSLQSKANDACALYERAYTASPAVLRDKTGLLEDLSHCTGPLALSMLSKLGGSLSADPQILLVLSREALREKKWDELKKLLERIVNQPNAPVKEIWSLARDLAYAKPDGATPILKKLADLGDVEAATFLGRVLYEGKRCSEAQPYLAVAQIAGKGVEEMLGHCQLESGDTTGAKQTYLQLYERTKEPLALRVLADLGVRKQDAEAEFWALSKLNEGNSATLNEKIRLGLLMHEKGDYDKSGALLDEALKQDIKVNDPNMAMASLHAGLWALEKHKTDRALRHLGNATRLLPDLSVGWKALGETQVYLGNWAEAGKAFARGSELAPDDSSIASGLMSAGKKAGDKKLLEKGYTALLRIDTNHLEANRYFAELYQGVKKCPEALPFLQRLTQFDPKDGKIWARFGNCLAETSNFALAGYALQSALDLGIDDDEVFVNRAMAYQNEGAKDMVESILSFVLSRSPKNEKARAMQAKLKQ